MLWANWFKAVLASLGLWQKEVKILVLGLDNAGKTTLLHTLKNKELVQHQPPQYPPTDELRMEKLQFKAFDLGVNQMAQGVWRGYYAKVDAVVYLVDANDRERFADSREELHALLRDETLANVPFLILGNKSDIPNAASEDELRLYMGLSRLITGKPMMHFENLGWRPLEVFMCSNVMETGFIDGFKWVSQYVK